MSALQPTGLDPVVRPSSPSLEIRREIRDERVIQTGAPLPRELPETTLSNRQTNWIEEEEKEADEGDEDLQVAPDTRVASNPPRLDRNDSSSSINSTDSTDSTASLPRHRSSCLRLVARRVRRVALPAAAIVAAANAPGVEAGPAMFAACIAGCTTSGPLAPGCYVLCSIALGAPTP